MLSPGSPAQDDLCRSLFAIEDQQPAFNKQCREAFGCLLEEQGFRELPARQDSKRGQVMARKLASPDLHLMEGKIQRLDVITSVVIEKGDLFAGIGEADITPALGIQIAGAVDRKRPVEEVRSPLLVQALIAEVSEKKMVAETNGMLADICV